MNTKSKQVSFYGIELFLFSFIHISMIHFGQSCVYILMFSDYNLITLSKSESKNGYMGPLMLDNVSLTLLANSDFG